MCLNNSIIDAEYNICPLTILCAMLIAQFSVNIIISAGTLNI